MTISRKNNDLAWGVRRIADDLIRLVEKAEATQALPQALDVLIAALDFERGDRTVTEMFRDLRTLGPFGTYDAMDFFRDNLTPFERDHFVSLLRALVDELGSKAVLPVECRTEIALQIIALLDGLERKALMRRRAA